MKKYEYTGEVKTWFGRTLHRIRATVKFGAVEAGELGGWIEKEENLAHYGIVAWRLPAVGITAWTGWLGYRLGKGVRV